MRLVIACVWVLILAKVVHSQEGCRSLPGEIYQKTGDSRHIVCNESSSYVECDHSAVEVLKIHNCPNENEFTAYQNVRTLDISFSNYKILNFEFLSFKYLKRLNVSYNNLTKINDCLHNDLGQLTEVDFSHNRISHIYKLAFKKVPNLKVINVSHNQIENLGFQSTLLFSGLAYLEILDLSDNKITEIPPDTFRKGSKLQTLNLRNNRIQSLDCSITQLLNDIISINVSFEYVSYFESSCVNPVEWTENEGEIIFKNVKTESELRYQKIDFKNLIVLHMKGNRLQNPLDLVKMLGKSIRILNLSDNHLGRLNGTAFRHLNGLKTLHLRSTNLSFLAESNPFEHLPNLTRLDISHNNLLTLNIDVFGNTLKHLSGFRAAGNHFDNGLDIIHSLGPLLWELDISQNFIGAMNRSTFEHFKQFTQLNLSDTELEHFDVEPLKVWDLDISRNKLKHLHAPLLSDTLNGLHGFHAADNEFENTAEIIKHLGSSVNSLDLSGSNVGKLDETSFEKFILLSTLTLRCSNLSVSDVKPFANVDNILDISNNNLTQLNFNPLSKRPRLKEINLRDNRLTQLDGLTPQLYPYLAKLDITNNKLNCTYLSRFKNEWKGLEIVENPCEEFKSDETQGRTDNSVEIVTNDSITIAIAPSESEKEAHAESITVSSTSATSSSPVVSYAVPIGVSILNIVVVAVIVVFFRRKLSSKNHGEIEVSYYRNDNGEEEQPVPQPHREEESKPEDHIYEEIEEREHPYDRLRFEFDPMPIATENQHYHNFTIGQQSGSS